MEIEGGEKGEEEKEKKGVGNELKAESNKWQRNVMIRGKSGR